MQNNYTVYESVSKSIHVNLALEDYLFRTLAPNEHRLFFWQNRPAVVIGRYQNPFLECAVEKVQKDKIAFARRQSGGGAVWHDEGNLCFSILGPKKGFDRKANIALICTALQNLGVPAEYNDKLDILVQGGKISGSAFRECADRAFHHGTLLVRADLKRLNSYLSGSTAVSGSKGISSRKSMVVNLADYSENLDISILKEHIAAFFVQDGTASIQKLDPEVDTPDILYTEYLEYISSWDWLFGKSPPFYHRLETGTDTIQLQIKNGIIETVHTQDTETGSILHHSLTGRKYDSIQEILHHNKERAQEQQNKKAADIFSRLLASLYNF